MWIGLGAGFFCGLYVGSGNFRHAVNLVIIWVLRSILWVFQKIDAIGRKKKIASTSVKVREIEDKETVLDDDVRKFFNNPDVSVVQANKR